MRYRYRSIDEKGIVVKGEMEANNLSDLELRLNRIRLTLIRAKPSRAPLFASRKVSRRDLIVFCFHMEQLTAAGIPLLEGLIDLRDSIEHPSFREVLANLVEDIEGGMNFSQALESHPQVFDAIFVNLVRAGETSGELPEVLRKLTETLKWQDELAAQTKKIMMYPAFVGTVVLSVVFYLMVSLVPQIVSFVKDMGQTLPLNTRVLLAVSDFFVNYWWVVIATPILAAAIIRFRLKTSPSFRFRFDGWKLTFPAIGPILRKIMLARFANFFAMMYAAGIPILECIKVSSGIVGNAVIAEALDRLHDSISEGQGVTAGFEEVRLFPPLVLRMLRVGETTGALDTALLNVSYFYDRDIKDSIEKVQAMIEPALTVVLGLILLWIMSAVLLPIFDTISKIR